MYLSTWKMHYPNRVELIAATTEQDAIRQAVWKFGTEPAFVEYVGIA